MEILVTERVSELARLITIHTSFSIAKQGLEPIIAILISPMVLEPGHTTVKIGKIASDIFDSFKEQTASDKLTV